MRLSQIDDPAFLLVAGNLEGGQFLSEALLHGLEEPVMRCSPPARLVNCLL